MENRFTKSELERITALHIMCQEEAIINFLGPKFVSAFYNFADQSQSEYVFVSRKNQTIVGVCIMSLDMHNLVAKMRSQIPLTIIIKGLLSWKFLMKVTNIFFYKIKNSKYKNGRQINLPEVLYIFTDPKVQGEGIGTALLATCEACLKTMGIKDYVVKTWTSEAHPAVKFYKKNGFVEDKKVINNGKVLQFMKKTIH